MPKANLLEDVRVAQPALLTADLVPPLAPSTSDPWTADQTFAGIDEADHSSNRAATRRSLKRQPSWFGYLGVVLGSLCLLAGGITFALGWSLGHRYAENRKLNIATSLSDYETINKDVYAAMRVTLWSAFIIGFFSVVAASAVSIEKNKDPSMSRRAYVLCGIGIFLALITSLVLP